MAEAEQILTTEVEPLAAKQPQQRQPRSLVEIITSQLAVLHTHYRAVLDTEGVEAVHKMRVTTRRLQASLDLLEREMRVRKLKRRLRGWRRKLSSVRNYDVFLELIEKETVRRGRSRREQLELVKAILQERRLARSAKVKRFLQGINVDSIAIGLGLSAPAADQALDLDQSGDESVAEAAAPKTAGDVLVIDERGVASYAAERLDQRFAEFRTLAAQSHPTNNPAELHQLRIAAKRVRYLLEIVGEMGFGDASRALNWLRTLQDRIGDWHDLEALEEEIIAIVSSGTFMKDNLEESSQMLQAAAHLQKKKEVLVSRLFPVRVPQYLEIICRRIARALRRISIRDQSPRRIGN